MTLLNGGESRRSKNGCSGSGESTVVQGLKRVVGLARRLPVAGGRAFVPGDEDGETLLQGRREPRKGFAARRVLF